jgi:uncharacterized protein
VTGLAGENVLLRIFIGEGDRFRHQPLYQAIVELLRLEGVAGATVLRGISGFGDHSVCHTAKLLDLSADLPLIVEVVDAPEKIESVLPLVEEMMAGGTGGMISREKVTVVSYKPKQQI